MNKLFGTDGIRGMANVYPMTPEVALKVGRAVAAYFRERQGKGIVIGRDTRVSGHMIESALISGICSEGCDALISGVLPTPGVAHLTAHLGARAGIMISASHNPFHDNGIKIFDGKGKKLPEQAEADIEALLHIAEAPCQPSQVLHIGTGRSLTDSVSRYIAFLERSVPATMDFKGLKIILDCANGATYHVAPSIFNELGADVQALFTEPDGTNINLNCGSQNIARLSEEVVKSGADLGLAFDGDGDRMIAVDENGRKITGDQFLAISASYLKSIDKLNNNVVVSTVMSNLGLGRALQDMGIEHVTTQVGDRFVLQKMLEIKASLGGEDSGHTIFSDLHTTGDGILSGLMLVQAMLEAHNTLSSLSKLMTVFPQKLINIQIQQKIDIVTVPEIDLCIKEAEAALRNKGRVFVRYSGTRPLCRVMVEGPTEKETAYYCQRIADIIQKTIGARR